LHFLSRIPYRWLILICVLPYLYCAFFNFGFFASDEYWTGITRYIPAQTSSIAHLIGPDDVKAPTQLLPFHALAQAALSIGIVRPFVQYQVMLTILALISTAILFLAFSQWPMGQSLRRIGFALLGFHFATAIAFTRPMFEALSAPLVAAAAVSAIWYDRRPRFRYLAFGAAFSTMAFLLRPQTGVIALTFVLLPLWKKKWRDVFGIAAVGALCFIVSGFIDESLTGGFHASLRRVLTYNVEHGSEYGAQPVWFFLPLIFLLGLGFWTTPSFFHWKIQRDVWRQKSLLVMLGLFVFVHSLFANKFERFLIPMIPVILFLIAPAIAEILRTPQMKLRRWSLLAVNGLFFFGAVFFEPQAPLLALVRFANSNPAMTAFVSLDETITWYPSVFQDRPVSLRTVNSGAPGNLDCREAFVVPLPKADEILQKNPSLHPLQTIQPGPIDWLAYHLNPSHNQRRAPLEILGCEDFVIAQKQLQL